MKRRNWNFTQSTLALGLLILGACASKQEGTTASNDEGADRAPASAVAAKKVVEVGVESVLRKLAQTGADGITEQSASQMARKIERAMQFVTADELHKAPDLRAFLNSSADSVKGPQVKAALAAAEGLISKQAGISDVARKNFTSYMNQIEQRLGKAVRAATPADKRKEITRQSTALASLINKGLAEATSVATIVAKVSDEQLKNSPDEVLEVIVKAHQLYGKNVNPDQVVERLNKWDTLGRGGLLAAFDEAFLIKAANPTKSSDEALEEALDGILLRSGMSNAAERKAKVRQLVDCGKMA